VNSRKLQTHFYLTGFTLIFSSAAIAGKVTKVQDNKVILDFSNETVPQLNSHVIILDQESHQEVGVIQITKTKDNRVLGLIKKGSAKPGDTGDIAPASSHTNPRVPAKDNSSEIFLGGNKEKRKVSRWSYGFGAELINTQMQIKTSGNSGSLTGNGFGIRGVFEYALTSSWITQASLGLHPLVMNSDDSAIQKINTNFLAVEGIVRYAIDKKMEGLWIGGGAGYYLVMSSNIKPKPTSDFGFIGSAGYNMKLGKSYFSLKGDFILLSSRKSGDYTMQPYQFAVGGIYFF